jgi:hypothetical protein
VILFTRKPSILYGDKKKGVEEKRLYFILSILTNAQERAGNLSTLGDLQYATCGL